MLKEVANDGWLGLELTEALSGERGEGGDRWRERVGHATLGPGVRLLLGIELRSVRRQISEYVVPGMRGDELHHLTGALGVQAVPDDKERPVELAAGVRKCRANTARVLADPAWRLARCLAQSRPSGVTTTILEISRRLLMRITTAIRPRLAYVPFIRIRKVWPVSSNNAIVRPRAAPFLQRWPRMHEPLGHEPLVSLLRLARRSPGNPTRRTRSDPG